MTRDATDTEKLSKRPTGIAGFDAMTRGGLAAGQTTLVVGGPGAGKTVFALQVLNNAAQRGESGVFVTFEESRKDILRNAASLGWRLDDERLRVIDARQVGNVRFSGEFDLSGLMAIVEAAVNDASAQWLVLDGIDQLVMWMQDPAAEVRELKRLADWLGERGLTTLLTAKAGAVGPGAADGRLSQLEYALSAIVRLSGTLETERLERRIRITKYRGTEHETNAVPMTTSGTGIRVAYPDPGEVPRMAATERVSTGIERLDELLGGGYFRGSSVLFSGPPGTSKTTLATVCLEAAARRGERALMVTFDESAEQITRNVRSVGLDLTAEIDRGHLLIRSLRHWRGSVADHFVQIQDLLDRFRPQFLAVDPISAMTKAGSANDAYLAIERLVDLTKARGITAVLTSLEERSTQPETSTMSHVSTLADTWITVAYRVVQGERNRELSIVKSRGTEHSNQVRELLLGPGGVDLADVYAFGSEVLMGTARIHREMEAEREEKRRAWEARREHERLREELEEARLAASRQQKEVERLEREVQDSDLMSRDIDADRRRHDERVLQSRHGGGGARRSAGASREGE